MTGVELVLAALAAGASAGVTETAGSAIHDAYAGLRESVRRRLAERGESAVRILSASEAAPGAWQARLGEELTAAGVDRDEEVVAAARALLAQLGLRRQEGSGYSVDAREAKGVQVGNQNHQTNTFN
ncbi:hypothetical protein AB0E10_13230 [Streptomyces sp. NPDC048045]|uniref:hypothetical protein n=1 Tax=Streptomyces sp. NPDC048045 TaxID=3154710 RepID=UPI00341283E2